MKKFLRSLGFTIAFVAGFSSMACTENTITKQLGGSYSIDLPVNRKLEMITWKNNNLWVQTRVMREDEFPEEHKFSEKSSLGMMEGTIIVTESTDREPKEEEVTKEEVDCSKEEQEYCLGRCSDLAEVTKNQCNYICGVGLGVGEKLRK